MKADNKFCECNVLHQEAVQNVTSQMPPAQSMNKLSELYKNFADPTRVKILWALSINEMCVCDLAATFEMSVSAVSHQLKILRISDLVKFRREGKVVYYSLSDNHVRTILNQGQEHINEG